MWHSSLTLENFQDLERVQKNALKIILQDEYQTYSNALEITGLPTLFERRSSLSLKFAKSCVTNKQTSSMFPLNPVTHQYNIDTSAREKYYVTKARTERLRCSAIPYMQGLLNSAEKII